MWERDLPWLWADGKLIEANRAVIPKWVHADLGIADEVVFHAERPSEPPLLCAISSPGESWDGVELAKSDVSSGKTHDVRSLSRELRGRQAVDST